MKTADFVFRYQSDRSIMPDSICRIRWFDGINNRKFVLVTDLGSQNLGANITLAIENIRNALIQSGLANERTEFIEHYEKKYIQGGTFDFFYLDENSLPTWCHSTEVEVVALLECGEKEFENSSLKQKYVRESLENYYDEFKVISDKKIL